MLNGRNVKMQEGEGGGANVEQNGGKDFISLCEANTADYRRSFASS